MRNPLIALSLIAVVLIITNTSVSGSVSQQQTSAPNKSERPNLLTEDTPVKLRLSQNLSSASAKVNDKVEFEVVENIKVGDLVVISQGSTAIGTVTKASTKKSFGRAGKLDINIDYVRLVNSEKASLRAVKGGSGGSHTGAMTGAVVATAIIFFPAAPLFFFIKGKNIEIPKGTEITAFVAADIVIDPANFAARDSSAAVANAKPSPIPTATMDASTLAAVLVKSTPDACDIIIDGKFVGSTTSTLRLAPGEHTILIEKSGYKQWQRTISVSANANVTVDATLEKEE